MKIKITNLNGAIIEIDVDENITFKELKEAYVSEKARKKEGEPEYTEEEIAALAKEIFEAEFNLQLALGEKIPDNITTLKDALLKGAVLKGEVNINAINITRPKPITDCLSAIKKLRLTVSPLDKLVKTAEILSREIGTDGENGTPILASSNKDIVLAAVKQNGSALRFAHKDLVLEAVQQNGLDLVYASLKLKADRDVVLEAVKQNGRALQFASPELKVDKEFMLAAMQQNGLTLQYAPKELQNDYEIVLTAVKQNGLAIAYASEDLRKDSKIGSEAMKQDQFAPGSASKELKSGIINESPLDALKKPSIMPTGAQASISSSDSKAKQPNHKLNI